MKIDPIEGIFRKDSGVEEIEKIKKKINKHEHMQVDGEDEGTILNMGKAVIQFFMNLPEPIFSDDDRTRFAKLLTHFETPKELERTMNVFCLAFNRIDALRRKYVMFSLNLFYAIAKQKEINKMSFSLLFFSSSTFSSLLLIFLL